MDLGCNEMPCCCKAFELGGFPYDYEETNLTVGDVKKYIIQYINGILDHSEGYEAVIFCTCNAKQTRVIKALEELGFYGLPNPAEQHYSKKEGGGVRIWPFMLPLNEWEHN